MVLKYIVALNVLYTAYLQYQLMSLTSVVNKAADVMSQMVSLLMK